MKEDILEQSVAQKILKSVLVHYGLNVSDLMSKLNLSGTTMLYDINSGKTKNTSRRFVELLKGLYPELNEVYLRTGRGEMIITPPAEEPKKVDVTATDLPSIIVHLVSVIAKQTQTINALVQEVNTVGKSLNEIKLQLAMQQQQKNYNIDPFSQGKKISDESGIKDLSQDL